MMKNNKFRSFYVFIFAVISPAVFAQQSIECRLDVRVIASQNYPTPVTQTTSIKNDGSPMLLMGIEIHAAQAINASKKISSHRQYCSQLIGQRKDAYLSGTHDANNILLQIGDRLIMRNIHSSGKNYPYWPDFYIQQQPQYRLK